MEMPWKSMDLSWKILEFEMKFENKKCKKNGHVHQNQFFVCFIMSVYVSFQGVDSSKSHNSNMAGSIIPSTRLSGT